MQKNSSKNYSSGKKGTIFLGGHPNPKKHSFQNYSSGKKGTIFLGASQRCQKNSFKNFSSKTKEKIGRLRNMQKRSPKIVVPRKRNYISWKTPKPGKAHFQNHPIKRTPYFLEGSETYASTASKIIVPKKKELYISRKARKPGKVERHIAQRKSRKKDTIFLRRFPSREKDRPEILFEGLPNPEKGSFNDYRQKRRIYICSKAPKLAKTQFQKS